jgi:phospholipid transport system substrate-binding protein
MISRRKTILSFLIACALALSATPDRPLAAPSDGVREFIKVLSDEAVAVIADRSMDEKKRMRELHRLFVLGFDTRTIGRFVLGRHWRAANENQRGEYLRLFEDFVVRSYAHRLGEYAGERLVVKGVRVAGGGDDFFVSSEIVRSSGPALRVDWRVRPRDKGYKIVDVIVEGVSMLITQRDEFASVIRSSGGDLEGLLVALRRRTTAN